MFKKPAGTYPILLIYIVLVILYHLFGYTGHFGYDDLHYAELAADFLRGSVNFEDHYAYRFPVILLTALFYLIFGISDLSSSLPALVITISILLILYKLLKEQGPRVLIAGLSLCTFSNWFIFYSDKLMPDIFVALAVLWALAVIHRYKYKSDKRSTLRHAFLLAFSLLFGFMSKGTIVLVLPLLIFLVITDVILKRDLKFWVYSLLCGIFLMSLYLGLVWMLTGNPFERFDAIAGNAYLNLCSYDQQGTGILLRRIFVGFFGLAVYQSLATGFIFVFAAQAKRKGLQVFRMSDSHAFFASSAVILFLSSSFMSISLGSYAPMCLDPRHYLFLLPVVAIPASRIVAEFPQQRNTAIRILVILLGVSVISYFLEGNSFWKLYMPLTALFAFFYLIRNRWVSRRHILLFSLILLLLPLEMIRYARELQYRRQRALLKEEVLLKHPSATIVTNEVQKRLLQYYSRFDEDQMHRFVSYEEFETDPERKGDLLLLQNGHTRYLSGMDLYDLPVWARDISGDAKALFRSDLPEMALYAMQDLSLLHQEKITLFSSMNDYETPVPFWDQQAKDLSNNFAYAGTRSNRIREFSSTFAYPLDSLDLGSRPKLLVQCHLYCLARDKTNARIIVSLENSQDTPFWKSLEVSKYLKAYDNWWPVKFELPINDAIQPGTNLKVYVWKTDNSELYIDNFAVRIAAFCE